MQFFRKTWWLALVPAAALSLTGCDMDVEDTGELPDVNVQEGEMPEVDVETPEVDVEKEQVEIPDEVTVPDVDVDLPEDDGSETGNN